MILLFLQAQGFVTVDEVQRRLSWPSGRATDALETLLDVSFCCCFYISFCKICTRALFCSSFWELVTLVLQCRKVLQWLMMVIKMEDDDTGFHVYLLYLHMQELIPPKVFLFTTSCFMQKKSESMKDLIGMMTSSPFLLPYRLWNMTMRRSFLYTHEELSIWLWSD